MKSLALLSRLAPPAFAVAAAFPSLAQPVSLNQVVVTATRTPTDVGELVSDLTVIDRQTIEASTARTLSELLARTAGVQIAANGGLGKSSSVFIRGTEGRHTLMLVDGVRLGSATLGTPNWDNIPVDMIERIEVLKGPASALYGSEAAGGVVQIFLRKGREGFHPYASATVGSEQYSQTAAGVQAGQGTLTYAVGVQRTRDGGFSATNPRALFGNYNPDRDPFEQNALSASVRHQVSDAWSADAGLLYSDGFTSFDDGPAVDSRSRLRDVTAHAGVKGRLSSTWESELRFSRGDDTSNTIQATNPGAFTTHQSQWTWQNHVDTPAGQLIAGLEQRVQQVTSSTFYTVTRRTIDSAFAGINGSQGNHSWQANLRHDTNSQFGNSDTGFAGYGYRIAQSWRIHASHGTSFVAPSFNQLYFPSFGNPALQPERGRNTDIGVAWAADGQELKLVRFDNRIRGFITDTTLPSNIPKAHIDGWTLGYDGRVSDLSLRGSFDLLNPRNELNSKLLPRRAKQQLTLGADYRVGPWRFGASAIHVGNRFDDAANTRPLAAFTTVDLHADWQFARDWTGQVKVDNLTDRQYETAYGFNQPRRAFYLTLRWMPS